MAGAYCRRISAQERTRRSTQDDEDEHDGLELAQRVGAAFSFP